MTEPLYGSAAPTLDCPSVVRQKTPTALPFREYTLCYSDGRTSLYALRRRLSNIKEPQRAKTGDPSAREK
ncbi:MAG: hypothetical protein HY231_21905 [Acidobacteria bacterium]|nr:hypothetical protein [Acidobacteriota bacterium]